jgi:gluconate 5-dehydrogenase
MASPSTRCAPAFITELSKGLLDTVGEALLPTIPLGRFGGEADLIGPAMLLVAEAGRHITGQTIVVDGGMTSV